jgi:alpha-glucosidase
VHDLDDEYLFGPDLLVAPVFEPGQTARHVYLPGGDWYDWHTDELAGGGRYVLTATPMDRIPIYARGGAVIPMWPAAPASTAGHRPAAIELHLFVPARDGTHESLLQEDDGLTTAAVQGGRLRTTFRVSRHGATVAIEARVEGDGYPEFAREEFQLVVHGAAPAGVTIDGTPAQERGGRFVIANAGAGFAAELTM